MKNTFAYCRYWFGLTRGNEVLLYPFGGIVPLQSSCKKKKKKTPAIVTGSSI